jgi:hypothetical protein
MRQGGAVVSTGNIKIMTSTIKFKAFLEKPIYGFAEKWFVLKTFFNSI